MGSICSVLPLPNEKDEIVCWLHSQGIPTPKKEGRFPTIEELCDVLNHLEEYTIEYCTGPGHWYATVSHADPPLGSDWAFLVVSNYSGNDADLHSFCFECWSPRVTIRIAQRVARTCGPLLLFPDTGNLPLVVTAELNIDQVLQEWST